MRERSREAGGAGEGAGRPRPAGEEGPELAEGEPESWTRLAMSAKGWVAAEAGAATGAGEQGSGGHLSFFAN